MTVGWHQTGVTTSDVMAGAWCGWWRGGVIATEVGALVQNLAIGDNEAAVEARHGYEGQEKAEYPIEDVHVHETVERRLTAQSRGTLNKIVWQLTRNPHSIQVADSSRVIHTPNTYRLFAKITIKPHYQHYYYNRFVFVFVVDKSQGIHAWTRVCIL